MSNVETSCNEINDKNKISIDYNGKKYNYRDYPRDETYEFYSVEDLKEVASKFKGSDVVVEIYEDCLQLCLMITADDYFESKSVGITVDILENYEYEWLDSGFNFYKDQTAAIFFYLEYHETLFIEHGWNVCHLQCTYRAQKIAK